MICKADILCIGRVQGVFYRASTKSKAKELGITGWVRNELNGDVRIVAYGEERILLQLRDWCKTGPELARVDNVIFDLQEVQEEIIPAVFEVLY